MAAKDLSKRRRGGRSGTPSSCSSHDDSPALGLGILDYENCFVGVRLLFEQHFMDVEEGDLAPNLDSTSPNKCSAI
jgi:hypothetical protein